MKRDIYAKLEAWKASPRRKPLIINGARQVGKTHALQHFARVSYQDHIRINFERDPQACKLFEDSLAPEKLLPKLQIYCDHDIQRGDTLIIFDEIQDCPRALNSLKYFCEEAPDVHIAAAGSLLGVRTPEGFPVGKVNFLDLYPMNFFEFLTASKNQRLRDHLESLTDFGELAEPLHLKAIQLLKTYLFVGGMPEAVATYVGSGDLKQVRSVQLEILDAYERDFAKHAPASQVMKITNIWHEVPKQLAKENKKFIFAEIRKSARARDFDEAIAWLTKGGFIYRSRRISTPKLPLSAYAEESIFKLFLLDVGLLGALSRLAPRAIIEEDYRLFTEFKGALTENYVGQELSSLGRPLYYWASEGTAELDFITEKDGEIYPLEVKAGRSSKKKSLLVYGDRHPDATLSRATLMNLRADGRIFNYPLYLVSRLPLGKSTFRDS